MEKLTANLTEHQIMYLRGKRYENEKKMRGGQGSNQFNKEQIPQNEETAIDPKENQTRFKLAKEYGVSHTTIERDAKFAKGIDSLPPQTKEAILAKANIQIRILYGLFSSW